MVEALVVEVGGVTDPLLIEKKNEVFVSENFMRRYSLDLNVEFIGFLLDGV